MTPRSRVTLTACLAVACAHAAVLAQVPYARLASAEREPASWLTYSGTYDGHRFSPLAEITPENVARLRPAWVYQVVEPGLVEMTPIVADGVMYVTESRSQVAALDLRTGRTLWRYDPQIPKAVRAIGYAPVNRGVAVLNDRVYVGTLNAHLVALDAASGAVRWDVQVADNALAYGITSAPLAVDGKIIIGVSGGEAGIRGFLDAYDAATGARLWRFYTVPGPGEPGHDSWGGDSWKTGGAPTWLSGSYDPELNLLYWGVGNPAPDWNGDHRPGDNLYSSSLIALDARTGALKWHFQFTPHDTHDWDANQIPVLVDAELGGRSRRLVVTANRNGFYYVLDRATGEFLKGTAYAKQTWARGLDARGRPMVLPDTEPSEQGTLVWPSLQGATNWFSPSYDASRRLLFVPVREMASRYFKAEAEYVPGTPFMGGGEVLDPSSEAYGAVRALDVVTGERRWEHKLLSPLWAGVMATAGGLVFGSTNEGNVFALDAASGRALWDFQTGGACAANPVSFQIDGRQHVATACGRALFIFALP
ncbi:MAG: PQQ-dependent dehydrogenase, methanol/ethanol family [Acidobacteria bacterium]|nr:PQQ-dependent dehydrogenase, methanol/ethanol family [Acidobacteriota bacterium]